MQLVRKAMETSRTEEQLCQESSTEEEEDEEEEADKENEMQVDINQTKGK